MKKLALVLLLALSLVGCNKKPVINDDIDKKDETEIVDKENEEDSPVISNVDIKTTLVDMSAYDNMSSTKHNFKEVNLFDVYDFIEKGGSGIFYLGYTSCHNCMTAVQYINQAAEEMGVTVYYINIDREDYHVADNKDVYNEVVEKLNPILGKDATGEKGIFTPDVFQVINGEFGDYFVGVTDDFDASNPEKTKKLVDVYKNLMKPFKKAA